VFSSGGRYRGEQLHPIQADYFAAVRADTVAGFLAANPGLVHGSGEPTATPAATPTATADQR
jgi:hypothetical protein